MRECNPEDCLNSLAFLLRHFFCQQTESSDVVVVLTIVMVLHLQMVGSNK